APVVPPPADSVQPALGDTSTVPVNCVTVLPCGSTAVMRMLNALPCVWSGMFVPGGLPGLSTRKPEMRCSPMTSTVLSVAMPLAAADVLVGVPESVGKVHVVHDDAPHVSPFPTRYAEGVAPASSSLERYVIVAE